MFALPCGKFERVKTIGKILTLRVTLFLLNVFLSEPFLEHQKPICLAVERGLMCAQ